MSSFDILSTFLLVLSAVLYLPASYYSYKLAAGKGERRLFLLLIAVIMLFLRRVYVILEQTSQNLAPNIGDNLLANVVSLSMTIATREINKLFSEIFKPILQSEDKEKLVS